MKFWRDRRSRGQRKLYRLKSGVSGPWMLGRKSGPRPSRKSMYEAVRQTFNRPDEDRLSANCKNCVPIDQSYSSIESWITLVCPAMGALNSKLACCGSAGIQWCTAPVQCARCQSLSAVGGSTSETSATGTAQGGDEDACTGIHSVGSDSIRAGDRRSPALLRCVGFDDGNLVEPSKSEESVVPQRRASGPSVAFCAGSGHARPQPS